ncbi:hypothetical protein NQ314_004045 [Rhamnusium bicolor]|uniref:Telomere length regulation protein conserved domain-containing protein n=1 Tax=Rhamnusium bicolor TaxID=1586634 RepID=A0AAV8ZKF7_9CUCU|nr:hypothetical protein NQ314_004045 [Rhamnusium bicolor]
MKCLKSQKKPLSSPNASYITLCHKENDSKEQRDSVSDLVLDLHNKLAAELSHNEDFMQVNKQLKDKMVKLYDHNFPFTGDYLYEPVNILFSVEDHNLFQINFDILVKHLREDEKNIADVIVSLLQILLKSEGFFACNVYHALDINLNDKFLQEEKILSWNNFLKVLLSLPNRVANILKLNVGTFFLSKNFTNFLIFNLLRTIEFLSDFHKFVPQKENGINYQNIALLLSKILVNFNERLSSEALKIFVEIVAILTNKSSDKSKLYQRIFQRIFENLERPAVEILAKLFLLNIDPTRYLMREIWGKDLIKNEDWKFVLLHLESSVELVRISGMKTGEILINFLNKEAEKTEETQLKFEYENLKEESKNLVNELQNIANMDMHCYFKIKNKFETSVDDLLEKLVLKEELNTEYIPPERKFRHKANLDNLKNEVMLSNSFKTTNTAIKIIDSTDFELDSDDDLEPYDLSNDVKVSKQAPPAYLRDLRDGLLETEDHEIFAQSLEICEKIIISQLPDDDATIGLEILEILISLEPRFYVEKFERVVFQSCIAITCVYPAFYAEYLCKQIHADLGTYSIARRVFMLDILRQVAKILSNLKPNEKTETRAMNMRAQELNSAEEVIRKRLESKTRYFTKHKYFKLEKANEFAEVAGYFFFPLLYAPRMAREILQFSWYLRFHRDVKVRMGILSLISSTVLNVPHSILIQDFINELFEIRLWLADILNPARGSVLTPTSAQPLQPLSSTTNNNTEKQMTNKNIPVGSTWKNSGNINIDLDNLLVNKPKTGPSPSMNQLASNPTSPINQPKPVSQVIVSPGFGTQLNFNNMQSFPQNHQNNQFFASFK